MSHGATPVVATERMPANGATRRTTTGMGVAEARRRIAEITALQTRGMQVGRSARGPADAHSTYPGCERQVTARLTVARGRGGALGMDHSASFTNQARLPEKSSTSTPASPRWKCVSTACGEVGLSVRSTSPVT